MGKEKKANTKQQSLKITGHKITRKKLQQIYK